LKTVLDGCEEGDHDVLHFVVKEDKNDLVKVVDAIKKHKYMEFFGNKTI